MAISQGFNGLVITTIHPKQECSPPRPRVTLASGVGSLLSAGLPPSESPESSG